MTETTVRLTEIFFSVQGESSFVGLPTIFIRLTGCPLRCVYCDSAYAFEGGQKWKISEILEKISEYPARHVCVTGGEPLAQPQCLDLLDALVCKDYQVSLETSGAMPVEQVNPEVARIVDFKTPSSGELA
ncbi:MAG: radical SAM protein, partial [Pseudomonadales bacterium]